MKLTEEDVGLQNEDQRDLENDDDDYDVCNTSVVSSRSVIFFKVKDGSRTEELMSFLCFSSFSGEFPFSFASFVLKLWWHLWRRLN